MGGQNFRKGPWTACQGPEVRYGIPGLHWTTRNDFIDKAIRHVELRQGMLGIQVKIMQAVELGKGSTLKVMPDLVKIIEPKEEPDNITPTVVSTQTEGAEEN